MSKKHHVLALAFTCGAAFPGHSADFENLAKARDGNSAFFASMNENLIDFPPWRKKPRPFSDLAFLSEDFILLAQPCEFLADILMRTIEQIRLLVLRSPPAQRRFRNSEIIPASLARLKMFSFRSQRAIGDRLGLTVNMLISLNRSGW